MVEILMAFGLSLNLVFGTYHVSLVYLSHNCLQHLWRCGAYTLRRTSSHRNYGQEIPTCAFPNILQGTGPQEITDGRKQKGFIPLLGTPLPVHAIF
jgi:hypothetical protein